MTAEGLQIDVSTGSGGAPGAGGAAGTTPNNRAGYGQTACTTGATGVLGLKLAYQQL